MTDEEIFAGVTSVPKTLDALDADTRRTLAALQEAPDGVAELAIATLGYWVRVVLAETHIIESFEDDDAPEQGTDEAKERPISVVLTAHGREVIAACADRIGVDPELAARMQRLREARDEYLAEGDDERYVNHVRDAVI